MTAQTRVLGSPPAVPARRRRGRGLLIGTAIVLVVVVLAAAAAVAVTLARIDTLVGHLETASAAAEDFATALTEDPESADEEIGRASDAMAAAQEELNAIPLAQIEALPRIGDNVTAVRTVLVELQRIAADSAPVLADAAEYVDLESGTPRLPSGGFGAWRDAISGALDTARAVPDALDALDEARSAVAAIDTDGLLPQVREGIDEVRVALDDAYDRAEPARRISDLLEGLL